jgi:formylglycine-generating enzyme required for sulfatase activity
MSSNFDPYHQWLGIPSTEQPPNHYRLLGIPLFEGDRSVIELAADRQMSFLRQHGAGPNGDASQKLLNEISTASLVLLNAAKRAQYDSALREQLARLKGPVEAAAPRPAMTAGREKTSSNGLSGAGASSERTQAKAQTLPGESRARTATVSVEESSAARKRQERKEIAALVPIARQLISKHDYGQAIQMIEQVAARDRTPELNDLLHEANELEEEADLLLADLRQSVHSRQLEGISDNLHRMLELKPGNKFARELLESLESYGGKGSGKRYQFDTRGNLLPADDGSWFEGARAAIVVGLVAFVAMSAAVTIYLKDGRQSVTVEIDEGLLKEGAISLVFEGQTFEIKGLGEKILLKPGPNGYEVRRGDQVIVGPTTYTVRKGEKNVLRISVSAVPAATTEVASTPPAQTPPAQSPVALPTAITAPFDSTQARAYQEQWARHLGVPVEFTNSIGMKFMLIPPHQYRRGTSEVDIERVLKEQPDVPRAAFDDEVPQHAVSITKPLYVGKYEVTVGEFRAFATAADYKTDPERGSESFGYDKDFQEVKTGPNYFWNNPGFPVTERHPASNVTWNDSDAFVAWLSRKEGMKYRLPTDAEWDQSCRAGTDTVFYTGNTYASLAGKVNAGDEALQKNTKVWYRGLYAAFDDGFAQSSPVGSFPANPFGLHDMHGNLWEWCNDIYDAGDYKSLGMATVVDPKGPLGPSKRRVARGGSWAEGPLDLRTARRNLTSLLDSGSATIGFRVALEIPGVGSKELAEIAKQAKPVEPQK